MPSVKTREPGKTLWRPENKRFESNRLESSIEMATQGVLRDRHDPSELWSQSENRSWIDSSNWLISYLLCSGLQGLDLITGDIEPGSLVFRGLHFEIFFQKNRKHDPSPNLTLSYLVSHEGRAGGTRRGYTLVVHNETSTWLLCVFMTLTWC